MSPRRHLSIEQYGNSQRHLSIEQHGNPHGYVSPYRHRLDPVRFAHRVRKHHRNGSYGHRFDQYRFDNRFRKRKRYGYRFGRHWGSHRIGKHFGYGESYRYRLDSVRFAHGYGKHLEYLSPQRYLSTEQHGNHYPTTTEYHYGNRPGPPRRDVPLRRPRSPHGQDGIRIHDRYLYRSGHPHAERNRPHLLLLRGRTGHRGNGNGKRG